MTVVDDLLDQTNLLHKLIRIPKDFDSNENNKEIIAEKSVIASGKNLWKHSKRGSLTNVSKNGFTLEAPSRYDSWAPGDPTDGDYVGYGNTEASLKIDNENWQEYDRLAFRINTKCSEIINPNIIFEIHNDGKQKIPDQYNREGYHVINLSNNCEKTYFLNISDLPRDKITEIGFSYEINGSYMDIPGEYSVELENISLQKVLDATPTHGWKPNKISYSHDGYQNNERKVAIVPDNDINNEFSIIDAETKNTVFNKKIENLSNELGKFKILDFTDLDQSGIYQIKLGTKTTAPFKIGTYEDIWGKSIPKVLNFIYGERCGYPVPGIHGTCHEDVIAKKDEKTISYNGGWHDAGDLSQQLIHSAEATQALFRIANVTSNQKLSERLLEEGNWGLDFIFKTDFGNGFHATSAGVSRWTDNMIGTMDDALARVHDNPYENFLLSSILADISQQKMIDQDMQKRLEQLSVSYFEIALKRFKQTPYEKEPIMWEHTYNTSKATYNATIVAAAGDCYFITKDEKYLSIVIEFMNRMINCQESKGLKLFDGTILKGMFYRDASHKVLQHFNHQAREMLFAQAFSIALKLPISEVLRDSWKERARDYGEYLLYLRKFTYPYPMISSGVYLDSENADKESFDVQHLLIDDSAYSEYETQLKAGVQVSEHAYIRRFPVWFSFRGNDSIILSTANSAAIMGRLLKNKELMDLANAQLRWIIGNNPFDQSLMFGEGNNYQQEYSNSSGDMVGELPVGIETKDDEDVPYWPQFNNATYKEVWIVAATKWLSTVSELIKGEEKDERR
ncbi:glycoside hydrolase family 9 protein [Companilactobacillus paralimentarius]|uniref:glycoside hydrolase family 9 protein n=1 Tax=Companilactobacillus paralimentarius TaxID=83526 RepID=UPI00384B1CBE